MDPQTIKSYNLSVSKVASVHSKLAPTEIYDLVLRFFSIEGETADIGCGTGRDTQWLHQQGFKVQGVDASVGMLDVARSNHPSLIWLEDSLPALDTLPDSKFDNLLCSAVLMHLPQNQLRDALANIFRVLKQDGIVILSFRGTSAPDKREQGKLYCDISHEDIAEITSKLGGSVEHNASTFEKGRRLSWHNMVLRKRTNLAEPAAT